MNKPTFAYLVTMFWNFRDPRTKKVTYHKASIVQIAENNTEAAQFAMGGQRLLVMDGTHNLPSEVSCVDIVVERVWSTVERHELACVKFSSLKQKQKRIADMVDNGGALFIVTSDARVHHVEYLKCEEVKP